jgi:hypothetical protein
VRNKQTCRSRQATNAAQPRRPTIPCTSHDVLSRWGFGRSKEDAFAAPSVHPGIAPGVLTQPVNGRIVEPSGFLSRTAVWGLGYGLAGERVKWAGGIGSPSDSCHYWSSMLIVSRNCGLDCPLHSQSCLRVSPAVSKGFPAEGGHRSLLLGRERRALRQIPCRHDEPSTR